MTRCFGPIILLLSRILFFSTRGELAVYTIVDGHRATVPLEMFWVQGVSNNCNNIRKLHLFVIFVIFFCSCFFLITLVKFISFQKQKSCILRIPFNFIQFLWLFYRNRIFYDILKWTIETIWNKTVFVLSVLYVLKNYWMWDKYNSISKQTDWEQDSNRIKYSQTFFFATLHLHCKQNRGKMLRQLAQ